MVPTISTKRSPGSTSTTACASWSPDLPPVVAGADRDAGGLARAEHPLPTVDQEADLSPQDVEALGERGVKVLGRHSPAGLDKQVCHEHPLGMLVGVGQNHRPLAGDRVVEDLTAPRHARLCHHIRGC